MEVRLKGTNVRVPFGSLIHTLTSTTVPHKNIENQGDTPIYNMLRIAKPTNQWLGKGSTGTVYHASFVLPKHSIDCVVKFPNTLLRDECILISEQDGSVTLNPKKRDEAKEDRRQGLEDLETEWHNAFLLHFGKAMIDTRIAEPYHVTVSGENVVKASEAMALLRDKWGYHNIHQLLAMDASVPCLISEHFDMDLIDWARQTQPSRAIVNGQVARQMLAGLHYMHHHALLAHMDIKPQNMLYSQRRQNMVLSDFGASRAIDAPCHDPAGTIGYCAPEILVPPYTPRYADAYSLAVTMLHLMHPDVPCENDKQKKAMLKQLMDREQLGQTRERWSDIIECAVPAERYPILRELMHKAAAAQRGLWIQRH